MRNYEKELLNEIEQWFNILPYFIEKIEHLEIFYEEWEYSTRYDLVDGVIKDVDNEFIKYDNY
ncbi:MAG: hypothetical protein ACLUCH_03760 [Lachnospirales bacterium]